MEIKFFFFYFCFQNIYFLYTPNLGLAIAAILFNSFLFRSLRNQSWLFSAINL